MNLKRFTLSFVSEDQTRLLTRQMNDHFLSDTNRKQAFVPVCVCVCVCVCTTNVVYICLTDLVTGYLQITF